MNGSARLARPDAAPTTRVLSDAALKAATAWVAQFARTLKTCRLYDAANPTVLRFRDDLANATQRMLEEHGPITYRFASQDVTCDGESVYAARSRDDNLAYPFHRDGVRSIRLQPGLDARELAVLIDSVLAVTGANLEGDDLVTLLWEADLKHLEFEFIPAEGEVGTAGPAGPTVPTGGEGDGPLLPWPSASTGEAHEPPATDPAGAATATGRSEDWTLDEMTVEVEASFVELDALAPVELERFLREFTDEHLVAPVTAALAIATACLNAGAVDEDREEMSRFMPRVLRGALALGAWADAREGLKTMRTLAPSGWSEETLVQELLQPVSVVRMVERLDAQDEHALGAFIELAHDIGDAGIDWMTLALCESQQRPTRQALAEAIAERCRQNPERLASLLSDSRWYVVRNIVHILSWIGGPAILGLLQVALRHEDARVRVEVVAALTQVELRHARPLLIRALDGADTRLFCQVLSQLSGARDPATARFIFAFIPQDRFPERPAEERRAIYAALASVGGNEIVPDLEVELHKGNWFDRALEIHRHNVARCLARIGTPIARAVLERGAQSKRAPVRHAALTALATMGDAA
jgi:HEAT repeat protein